MNTYRTNLKKIQKKKTKMKTHAETNIKNTKRN